MSYDPITIRVQHRYIALRADGEANYDASLHDRYFALRTDNEQAKNNEQAKDNEQAKHEFVGQSLTIETLLYELITNKLSMNSLASP